MEWLDDSGNANCFRSMYIDGFIDISGIIVSRDPDIGFISFGDVSFNKNLYVKDNLIVDGELSVKKYNNDYIINTTTTEYTLIVAEDLSLNGRLFVSEDVSLNEDLYVKGTAKFENTIIGNISGNAATVSTLPTATNSALGGIKVGTNLTITEGVLSSKTVFPTQTYAEAPNLTDYPNPVAGTVVFSTSGDGILYIHTGVGWKKVALSAV